MFRVILIIYLMLMPVLLFGDRQPVMLKIIAKQEILSSEHRAVFRMGVEEVLTGSYRLIDQAAQEEALREQSTQNKKSCYDDTCLVDVGKMIAARGIFLVEVIKVGSQYAFKMRYIDIEQATTECTKSMFYKKSLNQGEVLLDFSKKITEELLNDHGKSLTLTGLKKEQEREVILDSRPSGARIFDENNRYIGTTPKTIKMILGSRLNYRFTASHYREGRQSIIFDRNKRVLVTLISVDIFNINFKANISADILINGILKGKTPLVLKMKQGIYDLTVTSDTRTIHKKINVNRSGSFSYKLYHQAKTAITSYPAGASVKINGIYKGVTPLKLDLDIHLNKIKLSYSGYYDRIRDFTPSKYKKNKLHLSMTKRHRYRSRREKDGILIGMTLMQLQWLKSDDNGALILDTPVFSIGYGFIDGSYKSQSRFYLMAHVPLLRMGFTDHSSEDDRSSSDFNLTSIIEPSFQIMYGWHFDEVINLDFGIKSFFSEIVPSDIGVVARFSIGFVDRADLWVDALGVEIFYGVQGNLIFNFVLFDFFGLID